ncbi:nuclear transport factor 2 family protein [Aetokthonos hydrillicola Thurmond2011]|jgi:steroid delta-isomerase-like uncharacterized protein|uniref:Nuclear transport factor 2 family protein n=1 Tax=Aetokthonos hydrillicola Thurmond2011 TaxID=2712845 RepID=A0AAP5IBP9_9CYAN|nr:nuclear transport factor 2 family protein [Aetokthonos hydrillicola]MBO3458761.1 hypothetical protein [Aetokthonos hydrillicola CCALA 1050]MBW4585509.1 nuclear transport factor 2 family protein [Aetokthonos hydrillicola CCALA 1050]MDR9896130.1 nuclear transport factor 2 family protein [Aetokthonos hydrillicola Thurmond2011]
MSNNFLNKLSRRQTLNLAGAGGVAAATAFMFDSHVIAKDRKKKLPRFIQEWTDIQNTNDAAALTSLYTEDGVIEAIPFKQRIEGKNDILSFYQGVFKTLTNITIEIVNGFATDEWAACDYNFIATNIGLVSTPSALNKTFNVRSSSLFILKDNKIKYYNENFDISEILVQVGVISSSPFSITSCQYQTTQQQ